jgi:hypothetical protein
VSARTELLVVFSALSCVFCTLAIACSSSGGGGNRTFKSGNHSCTQNDVIGPVSCDNGTSPTNTCTNGASACWIEGTTAMGGYDGGQPVGQETAALCAACCSGNTAVAAAGSCTSIACTTVNDCPLESTMCTSGYCSPQ